jgi:hypothetical protein
MSSIPDPSQDSNDELQDDLRPDVQREEYPQAAGVHIMERNTAVLGPSDTSDSGADV